MNNKHNTENLFFELLKAGLWEQECRIDSLCEADIDDVYRMSEEQSVLGLVTAGLDRVKDIKVPKEWMLQFIGTTLQIEQRNKEMNHFIGILIKRLQENNIYALLVKGQGIAQCYERPLWRSCGDVDLYLSGDNYQKAKDFLWRYAIVIEEENLQRKHIAMNVDSFIVELHGTMHTSLSSKICSGLDEVHDSIFKEGSVKSWRNGEVDVFLPSVDNNIIIIFTHFITHFYIGGLGLRQVCDWCRLLWKHGNEINLSMLEERIVKMGLMEEWKGFASLAVEYLGMPKERMPFYSNKKKYCKKAQRIVRLILEAGNFGQNKDLSYHAKLPKGVRPIETFFRRFSEFARLATIFPGNAPKFFFNYVGSRLK